MITEQTVEDIFATLREWSEDININHANDKAIALANYETEAELFRRFGPNSFGRHESMHLAWVYSENLETYLLGSPSVILNTKAYAMVHMATSLLYETYQLLSCEGHDED